MPCVVSLAVCLILLCNPASAQEYGQAYKETEAEYNSVAKSVTETQTQVNEMRGALVKTEKFLKKIPAGPEREKVKRMIRDARKSLNARSKQMGKFNTYAPEGIRFVYRSVNNPSKAFIWDEAAGEWYRVSNGGANLEQAYRESLLIGKRKSPFELKVLADKWDDVQARRKEADALYDTLFDMRYSSVAFMNVDDSSKGALSKLLSDKETFRAFYTYDQEGRKQIDSQIESVKAEIKRLQEEDKKAREKKREQEEAERLKRRKAFMEEQREAYEANHGKKLNDSDQREVSSLHSRIASGIESIGKSQERIDDIITSTQSCTDAIQEEIEKIEKAITVQLLTAADFQQKVSKIMAEAKTEETRKKFEEHLNDCQKALGNQTFCTAHAGGYYDWGVIAFDDLKSHHFGRSIKGNRALIEAYQKSIQAAMAGAKSGELRGIDSSWEVQLSKSYYYPSSINDIKSGIEENRAKIKAARGALETFERINTDPEPHWEMLELVDPGKQTLQTKEDTQ